VPLKSERLRMIFKRVENFLNDIQEQEKALQTKDGGSPQDLIKNYLNFVNVLDDAQVVIKKEKAEESKKSEQSGQVFNVLVQYITRLKLKTSVDRNLLQAKILAQKLDATQLFNPIKTVALAVRPQNIVRFYEKAMKSQKQLLTADRESMDPAAVLQNELQEKYQNVLISYYIALHYVQEHQSQGVKQALVILQSCQYKIEDTIEFA